MQKLLTCSTAVILVCVTSAPAFGLAPLQSAGKRSWDFGIRRAGTIAKGFVGEVGQWEVAKEGATRCSTRKRRTMMTRSMLRWPRERASKMST